MLVTFHCRAYANITLFGEVALCLLHFMGQRGTIPGAMIAEDVPMALSQLEAALEKEAGQPFPSMEKEEEEDIPLVLRAQPLIQLLKKAIDTQCDVMWSYATKAF